LKEIPGFLIAMGLGSRLTFDIQSLVAVAPTQLGATLGGFVIAARMLDKVRAVWD
jgi:hypothetical protein